ncbi:hypothetical protein GCM10010145_25230 [Streptomyces ruber]|uniref:Uncharacterized protein n=2 Tax=Streptomyces TaxID=1883 RepID=A0A918BBV5_9ACTN|nr:DUF3830 family protein [Streptomyces ruber]GGQ54638.1 hypothetical protein GCM10010145_25230 [Streptomyces ruber]
MACAAARFIWIPLVNRDVHATAELLDERAPRTRVTIRNALPLTGDAYHAKYARNEIYAFFPALPAFPAFAEAGLPAARPTRATARGGRARRRRSFRSGERDAGVTPA